MLGPKICVLKTHINIISDFSRELVDTLKSLSRKHDFLIFEDRKFADIGNTVRLQYEGGIYQISSWADMVNFHLISGPGILDGLKVAGGSKDRGFIIISQMSSEGNQFTHDYTKNTIHLAQENSEDIFAFICMNKLSDDPRFLHMTPGVKISNETDTLGQSYRTPEQAIIEQNCDIIIVGRGILQSENMEESAEAYRLSGWEAYKKRIGID